MSEDQIPDVVYHFTSMGVLLEILRTKELWATNVRYLNDISEHQLFLDAADRRVPECIPELGFLNLQRAARDSGSVMDHLPSFAQLPFVTSFSREDDSLTHWRSYCAGGNGVSIGFRTESLLAASVRKPKIARPGMIVPQPRFSEIYYFGPNDNEIVDEVIKASYREATDFNSQRDLSMESMAAELTWRLTSAASLFKDYSFINERECRLIVDNIGWRMDLLCFRTAKSTLIPYVSLSIPSAPSASRKIGEPEGAWNAIESITIGPTPNMSLSREAVEACCFAHGVSPTIKQSRVTYREL